MKKRMVLFSLSAALFILLFVFVIFWMNRPYGEIVSLLYHDLAENEIPDGVDPEYTTTAEKFERDMTDMQNAGYISLSVENLAAKKYDKHKDYFIVTFDDGYLSNYTIAFPILQKHKIYASIFICTESTWRDNHFSWEQAQIMEDSGFISVNSHSPEHKNLTEAGLDSFVSQIERSFQDLETKLTGKKLRLFAYPNGDYSRESVEALCEMGVVLQFVQVLPKAGSDGEEGWNWYETGLVRRYNVSYASNVIDIIAHERNVDNITEN